MTLPGQSDFRGGSDSWSVVDPAPGTSSWTWYASVSEVGTESGSAGSRQAAEALARAARDRMIRQRMGRL
jgi:hypothetical protein